MYVLPASAAGIDLHSVKTRRAQQRSGGCCWRSTGHAAVTCGLLQAAPRPGGRGTRGLPGVPGAFLAVWPSEARAAPPFQLCHHLVPGDEPGSEVHAVAAGEEGSRYWLLSQPRRFPSGLRERTRSLRASRLPASLLHPAVTPWGSAHTLLASSLHFLGSTRPHPSTPPTHGWGNRQLSKTWPHHSQWTRPVFTH